MLFASEQNNAKMETRRSRNISPFFVLRSITQNVSNQIYVMQSEERVKGDSRVEEWKID